MSTTIAPARAAIGLYFAKTPPTKRPFKLLLRSLDIDIEPGDKNFVVEDAYKLPVWVSGTHVENAFRRWRIWRCPVFARLDDMQVVAITRDVEEAKRWFAATR